VQKKALNESSQNLNQPKARTAAWPKIKGRDISETGVCVQVCRGRKWSSVRVRPFMTLCLQTSQILTPVNRQHNTITQRVPINSMKKQSGLNLLNLYLRRTKELLKWHTVTRSRHQSPEGFTERPSSASLTPSHTRQTFGFSPDLCYLHVA
jgi:hypothetical protein